MTLRNIDEHAILFFRRVAIPVARFGLFVTFFWFGILKIFGLSPASGLVEELFNRTIPFVDFGSFLTAFAVLEIIIGILFLIKGAERVVIPLLFFHMATTTLPLFVLPQVTWLAPFVPTLEGQYIIKNILIVAAGIFIAANLTPLRSRSTENLLPR